LSQGYISSVWAISGYTWQYLTTPNHIKPTWYQWVLFGTANTSSIIVITIPVQSWYHHDTVLTVLCLSGFTMILILVIFKKKNDA
jgi:hypothetical protein